MNAPAYEVVRGQMVRVGEPGSVSPRLANLATRAVMLGHGAQVVPSRGDRDDEKAFVSVMVRRNGNTIGRITIDETEPGKEETASLSVDCDAMSGLPMQADWLLEHARIVRDAFIALVQP